MSLLYSMCHSNFQKLKGSQRKREFFDVINKHKNCYLIHYARSNCFIETWSFVFSDVMMQLNCLSGVSTASDVVSTNSGASQSQTSKLLDQPEPSSLPTHCENSGFSSVLIKWRPYNTAKHPAFEPSTVSGENDQTSEDEDYRPFTPPPPRERLSYTRYQLALLNGIYQEVRYPNGTQKQLIAKRVGITREQVKIWFQNRRRKDVVTKGVKSKSSKPDNSNDATGSPAVPSPDIQVSSDHSSEGFNKLGDDQCNQSSQNTPIDTKHQNPNCDTKQQNKYVVGDDTTETSPDNRDSYSQSCSTSSVSQLVTPIVLRSMIVELKKFNNEYLKLKKSKKKRKKSKGTKPLVAVKTKLSSLPSFSSLSSCQAPRLFQNYDMLAPPNKCLNPTVNTTLHASETSAFCNPRSHSSSNKRLWDHANSTDYLQPYCSPESLGSPPDISPHSISMSAVGSVPSNSLSRTPIHEQTHKDSNSSFDLQSPPMTSVAHLTTASLDHTISAKRQLHTVMAPQATHLSTQIAPQATQPSTHLSHLLHRHDMGFSTSAMMSDSNNIFQPSPAVPQPLSLQRHHTSHFPSINRVYPFPLAAEPPVMLSNICQTSVMLSSISQTESYLHHPAWHSLSSSPTTVSTGLLLPENSYRPLLISSLNNPYFSPTYSSSQSSTGWPPSQTLTSDLNNNQFTQL
ncbi:hypothetical protein Btru_003136 [Bulinus truncatus]|nr:hypothetical protein Btru_003136 [Bulinus truncatus]